MSLKFFISLGLIILGLYLIINGSNRLHQSPAATFWKKTENFFTDNPMWNPIIEFFGGTPIPERASSSKASGAVTLVMGIILFIGGILHAFILWKKRRKFF